MWVSKEMDRHELTKGIQREGEEKVTAVAS